MYDFIHKSTWTCITKGKATDRWGECNNIKNSEFGGECLKQKQPIKQKRKTTTG